MGNQFHKNLNRMALFAAAIIVAIIFRFDAFMQIAATNIWLNGTIIGLALFGAGLCFVDIFKLLPEYKWIKDYFGGRSAKTPPLLLKPVAQILRGEKVSKSISTGALNNLLELILVRFEDQRESVRYITNTLIFLGLLGTFWGLIHTVGGFADMINGLDFTDENVMGAMQSGLSGPMTGMGTAFACSLFGLGGSLIVGFLGLQLQMAQNALFRELEDNLSANTKLDLPKTEQDTDYLNATKIATMELTKTLQKLERTVSKMTK